MHLVCFLPIKATYIIFSFIAQNTPNKGGYYPTKYWERALGGYFS